MCGLRESERAITNNLDLYAKWQWLLVKSKSNAHDGFSGQVCRVWKLVRLHNSMNRGYFDLGCSDLGCSGVFWGVHLNLGRMWSDGISMWYFSRCIGNLIQWIIFLRQVFVRIWLEMSSLFSEIRSSDNYLSNIYNPDLWEDREFYFLSE